ncbi:MAG: polymer-forming cytoskeletal protein [Tepidisphaeraceae bacterium]|jgi:cytoskeletal protein CcmA (bactofilin family)
MREERGQLTGDLEISEPYTLWGKIAGNITVADGGKLYVRGSVFGDLTVMPGGRVHILGNVKGRVIAMPRTKIIVGGVIGGDIHNRGGRVFIEQTAKILGKIKTKDDGETTYATESRSAGDLS